MHADILSKTLPPDLLRVELDRMAAKWTPGACSAAGKFLFGNTSGEWTLESLAKVDAHLSALAAQKQDTEMLERDEPKAKPAAPAEEPLAAVLHAIQDLRDEMFECALDEVQNSGRHDPDYSRADDAEAVLVEEVKRLLLADRMAFIASVQKPTTPPAADNGLLTSHNPDRRLR